MTTAVTESLVEAAALAYFADLGYTIAHGPDLAPDSSHPERTGYADVVLMGRLRAAVARTNPAIAAEARDEAIRRVLHRDSPSLNGANQQLHRYLTEGVPVEYRTAEGRVVHDTLWLADFARPAANDWLAVNQFTVVDGHGGSRSTAHRRPDIVVFLNGLPLALIELKNPADENATVQHAFRQLQTYQRDLPGLLAYNAMLVVSDGLTARIGTLTSDWERFMPWRTVEGDDLAPKGTPELETLVKGVFQQRRCLDLLRHFIVYETDGPVIQKKLAGYHQYHAVNKAIAATLRAAAPTGSRRAGVVWHTQGSGKSLTMVFYAGKIVQEPALANPTLVVLTDRNDLDGQLFATFAGCQELLRQTPVQAESREDVQQLLHGAASGGIIFTTIQKFLPETKGARFPLLSDRRNIVVIADEAHRSQYDFVDGFARRIREALPNASFLAFTGTPLEAADRSTTAVFGDYIDIYDLQQSVEDGATVRIYYESRLAKLALKEEERPRIDQEFAEVTEGEEADARELLKSRWARLEAMVGTPARLGLIARDLVTHFEQRQQALDGKAMIVGMSRRICVDLYDAIIALRPGWHSDDDAGGVLKVVMTGSASDPLAYQPHIRSKARRDDLATRFKDPSDPLKLVIVRDMWLTGFDAPCLHTMYLDKPMQGHGLMQAIARVNRVFRDKPGGLVVDYLGLADQLRQALAVYAEGDRRQAGIPQEQAVDLLLQQVEIVQGMYFGFDYRRIFTLPPARRMAVLGQAVDHILGLEDGQRRYLDAVGALSKAFALAVPHEAALALQDDVGFFQAVRAALAKDRQGSGQSPEDLDHAIRQIVSGAVASDQVIDLFAAAGLQTPDISILSDEFLAELHRLPQKNLALELLQRLLNQEIKARTRANVVQSRQFSAMLEQALRRYQNRSIETAQVIAELIELAKELRAARSRGEQLGLSEEELAFYDTLETNDSAVQVLGDVTLRTIARELAETIRRNTSIDWTLKESARARLRLLVKRLLRRHGYPPDKQERATTAVLEQAEALAREWAA